MYQKCHYFSREGGGPKRNYFALLLCHFVTIGQGRVGDKANLENITRYEVFFFWGVPYIHIIHNSKNTS